MSRIFCILGKSSSGKDTIYKRLLEEEKLALRKIVPYTTRPIRKGEEDGMEYFFTTNERLQELKQQGKVIECRSYHTFYGIWNYFTVKDEQIDLQHNNYLLIGTIESFKEIQKYFGEDIVIPLYIALDDGERLQRALNRERMQQQPKYEEMCRRFLADQEDFSDEKLQEAGINRIFYNIDLNTCIEEIKQEIQEKCDVGSSLI